MYLYFFPRFTQVLTANSSGVSLTDAGLFNLLGRECHSGKPVTKNLGFLLINDIRVVNGGDSGHVARPRSSTERRNRGQSGLALLRGLSIETIMCQEA